MKRFLGLLLGFVLSLSFAAESPKGPTVVTSILPLYHIAQAVVGKYGHVILLLPGVTEHDYALKPSQYQAIQQADLVVWIGPELETFLTEAVAQVPATKQLRLLQEPSMLRYNLRQNDSENDTDADTEFKHHEDIDPHLWLDPFNAMTIARQLERRLSILAPGRQKTYRRQAGAFINHIAALNITLEKELTPLQDAPFLTFHDAFQYFEKRYGLRRLDSISTNPQVPLSASRWMDMSLLLKSEDIHCIFSEPQNQTDLLKQLATENHARLGILNEMGTELPGGTEGYAALLTNIADNLTQCLNVEVKKVSPSL